jgi:hypothetical protein
LRTDQNVFTERRGDNSNKLFEIGVEKTLLLCVKATFENSILDHNSEKLLESSIRALKNLHIQSDFFPTILCEEWSLQLLSSLLLRSTTNEIAVKTAQHVAHVISHACMDGQHQNSLDESGVLQALIGMFENFTIPPNENMEFLKRSLQEKSIEVILDAFASLCRDNKVIASKLERTKGT